MGAGGFFVVADFIVLMTVLFVVGAAALGAVAFETDPVVPFFITVPVLSSLDSLTFRFPRVVVTAAGLLVAGLLAGLPAAGFFVRAAAVGPELEPAEDAMLALRGAAAVAVAAAPRAVPLALSIMLDNRFEDDGVLVGPFTGEPGRANSGVEADLTGDAGRSRAGIMRAFDEVGDRICPCWTDGSSTAGAPARIRFLAFSAAPWFSLSALLISSLRVSR